MHGVLNKCPSIEELLTPACIKKKQSKQIEIRQSQEKLIEKQKNKMLQQEYQTINESVDHYLAGLSLKQLTQMQSEFNNSIQGK